MPEELVSAGVLLRMHCVSWASMYGFRASETVLSMLKPRSMSFMEWWGPLLGRRPVRFTVSLPEIHKGGF